MIKTFEFFSDYLNNNLSIDIVIYATEDESWVEKLTIYDENGEKVPENSLTPDELRAINNEADTLASDNAYEAYQDRLEGMGDYAYDVMRDNEMFDKAMDIMNDPDAYIGENLDD